MLFVAYDGVVPHPLMARISEVGGTIGDKLALLTREWAEAGAAMREDGEVPMPPIEQGAGEVLADLAPALRLTTMTWPRRDDEGLVALRALVWARCRDQLRGRPERQPLDEAERARLLDAFTASRTGAAREADTVRSPADLFPDYGESYLSRGPLCWSPGQVAGFVEDWLPRKAVLDQEHRMPLPAVLTQWVTPTLTELGVEEPWISPVIAAVDAHVSAFRAASTTRRRGVRPSRSRPPSPRGASTSPTAMPSTPSCAPATPNGPPGDSPAGPGRPAPDACPRPGARRARRQRLVS
ncbi:hypothetical protein ACFC09_21065 [Streptomyces sp. NPDC056161]|uniref:hypothetical protein n=1 Tax=Streptomyces sp. NPDC056161 TaxID=3345732 RepID=UPI0035E1E8E3